MYKTDSKSYCTKISVQSVKVTGTVLKKYYKRPSSLPTGCGKKRKKDTEKMKTLRRKGTKVYRNDEKLCIGSWEKQPR